jgi:hypothetical protein
MAHVGPQRHKKKSSSSGSSSSIYSMGIVGPKLLYFLTPRTLHFPEYSVFPRNINESCNSLNIASPNLTV